MLYMSTLHPVQETLPEDDIVIVMCDLNTNVELDNNLLGHVMGSTGFGNR